MPETAIHELEALLHAQATGAGGMSVEMLDGYFSALIVGPALVPPQVYLPRVWGEALAGMDAQRAQRCLELTMAFWNHIVWRVAQPLPDPDEVDERSGEGFVPTEDDAALLPVLQLPGEDEAIAGEASDVGAVPESLRDYPIGALWAAGFLTGIDEADEAWTRWFEMDESLVEDEQSLLRLSLVDAAHAADMGMDAADVPGFEERWDIITSVPGLLQYCQQMRQDGMLPAAPTRRDPRPGRNDPCVCGSGRKYKKCCGAGAAGPTLH